MEKFTKDQSTNELIDMSWNSETRVFLIEERHKGGYRDQGGKNNEGHEKGERGRRGKEAAGGEWRKRKTGRTDIKSY